MKFNIYVAVFACSPRRVLSLSLTAIIDYCNSLFSCLPWSTVQPLQRVMNAVARVSNHALVGPDYVKLALKQYCYRSTTGRAKNYVHAVSLCTGVAILEYLCLNSAEGSKHELRSTDTAAN